MSSGLSRGLALALLLILTSGCTSTPAVVKVGLIAPFEGLYRESGYAALAAMRTALADCAPPNMAVVPVALDDSANPEKALRAAQKLLVDPAVTAIVGPMTPDTVAATQPLLEAQTRPWITPLFIDPAGGFAAATDGAWLTEELINPQLEPVSGRILVAGLPATLASEWTGNDDVVRLDETGDLLALNEMVMPTDDIVWLGDAAQGAAWLIAQRARGTAPAFWLANPVGGDIFAAHLAAHEPAQDVAQPVAGVPVGSDAHWLIWSHSDYNQEAAIINPELPIAELTYAATCTALEEVFGVSPSAPRLSSKPWRVQHRNLSADAEPAP